jgi:hypothetical protein
MADTQPLDNAAFRTMEKALRPPKAKTPVVKEPPLNVVNGRVVNFSSTMQNANSYGDGKTLYIHGKTFHQR